MADSLYLSIWFPSFREGEMMPRTLSVLRQFPFSAVREGVAYISVHPVAWTEPTVLERRFDPGISPEEAVELAREFAHDDFAFVFEVFWDLWVPNNDENGDSWVQRPSAVKFLVHGVQFDDGIYTDDGHIEVDFGLDSLFIHEGRQLTTAVETHLRANIAKLVGFSSAVEKHCAVSGRVLWSESEENLAQKLIARLQQTQ
ncbi:MAG TPA: hypothetical protein VKB58_13625 [Terriglobales bacterium]|nr:hypothetical protein [Terriglobales bacterium]